MHKNSQLCTNTFTSYCYISNHKTCKQVGFETVGSIFYAYISKISNSIKWQWLYTHYWYKLFSCRLKLVGVCFNVWRQMNKSLFVSYTNSATNFRFLVLRKLLLVNTLIDTEQLYLGPTQPLPTSARHMINSFKIIRLKASIQHTILTNHVLFLSKNSTK